MVTVTTMSPSACREHSGWPVSSAVAAMVTDQKMLTMWAWQLQSEGTGGWDGQGRRGNDVTKGNDAYMVIISSSTNTTMRIIHILTITSKSPNIRCKDVPTLCVARFLGFQKSGWVKYKALKLCRHSRNKAIPWHLMQKPHSVDTLSLPATAQLAVQESTH